MNWIRFVGSLRYALPHHQFLSPLSGPPGWERTTLCAKGGFVNCCSRGGLTDQFYQASGGLNVARN